MKKVIMKRFLQPRFSISHTYRHEYKKFNASGTQYFVKINHPTNANDPLAYIKETVTELIEKLLENASPQDMIGLTIRNMENKLDKPIGISFRRKDQLDADIILSVITKVTQSNSNFFLTDNLEIQVDHVRMINGNGGNKSKGRSPSALSHLKTSMVKIKATQNCLAHALVVSIAKIDCDPNYSSYRKGRKIERKAIELMQNAKVNLDHGGGIRELKQFQNFLKDYKIIVFNGLRAENIWFEGESNASKHLYLFYDEENKHFNVIINLTGAFAKRFVCKGCFKGSEHGSRHRCQATCSACLRSPPCTVSSNRKFCHDCQRYFRSEDCFNHHLEKIIGKIVKKSGCQVRRNCSTCHQFIHKNHQCFKVFCQNCKKNLDLGHQCFIQKLNPYKEKHNFMFVFFDIESTQDSQIDGTETYIHKPNLLVAQSACSLCMESDDLSVDCSKCGTRQKSFWDNPIKEFFSFLTEPRVGIENIICISHNGRSYDTQFILQHVVEKNWFPSMIKDGKKILSLNVEHMRFLDSLNFIPMPLAAFTKTFGLETKKGYYPHFFNTHKNLDYEGPIPPSTNYAPDYMSTKGRKEFFSWYEQQLGKVFINKDELESYCISDVTLLRQGALLFRKLMIETGNVDPSNEAITNASTCSKIFRRNFLKEASIGIIPSCGYRLADKQSAQAIKWLIYEEENRKNKIVHAANGREKRLPEFPRKKVDGYCEETGEIFEFLGCHWHGYHCQPNRFHLIINAKETLADRYEQTMARIEDMTKAGYTVHVMWECEFKAILEQDIEVEYKLNNHPLVCVDPIMFRDALYGGRTEAFKLEYQIKPGEKINYVDVMYLYPYVCKMGVFPLKHPTEIYVGDKCPPKDELLKLDGLVKCCILPPRQLYHPVLPFKGNSKLLFFLCHKCAILNCKECNHSDRERAMTGTWVMDELRQAIEMGYEILQVHEFIQYDVTQFDGNEGGLFVSYINCFLKIKQESSGYPDWVKTEDDKTKYIEDFEAAEGIKLDVENIEKNPGKRAIAKLALNSFWGRFAMRGNKTQTKLVKNPKELFDFLSTPGIEVQDLMFPNQDMLWVSWKYLDECIKIEDSVNLAIAAYVTTGARLKLYSFLKEVGESALYCDTDSLIYVKRPLDTFEIPLGDHLGDLTNELADYGPDAYINQFYSGGPKNYSYSVTNTLSGKDETVCKVRGFTLNFENSKKINFESIKSSILSLDALPIPVTNPKKIKRKTLGCIVSEPETKNYQVVFNKRRRLDNNNSLPFGYDPRSNT